MPHQVQMQVIKRRLVGKEGTDRVRELRAILQDLPGYRNGPDADIRAWVLAEIDRTDDASLDAFRDAVWGLTGLMRVATRRPGSAVNDRDPLAVSPGATVRDVVASIHGSLAGSCRGAHVWGRSVRYPGQLVGRDHPLSEDDVVELVT